MKKIGIITTRQNFAWISMQEVFPQIEECWAKTHTDSKIINVDFEPLREYIKFIISCDVLILIAFNETISRLIIHLRKTLNIQIPLILHLYGYATIACWPLKRFGMLEVLNAGDVFIGTCPGDLKCMELSFKNSQTLNIPYPYIPYDFEKKLIKRERVFAYIGRISDQKNVEIIIEAYKLLLNFENSKNIPPLLIYGKEDFLGWPNCGIEASNCLEKIKKLITEYSLTDRVLLMGFEERENIYHNIGKDHIFLSASTHSDENFGMAAMRSLAIGGNAVLSSWGGHIVFKNKHPDRVELIDVELEKCIAKVSPVKFALGMQKALKIKFQDQLPRLSDYFNAGEIINSFEKILNKIEYKSEKLEVTDVATIIYNQQIYYESMGYKQRAFKGHDDPLSLIFKKAYHEKYNQNIN
jgi:glycosyltransferase involved in cell wall biosynthesis